MPVWSFDGGRFKEAREFRDLSQAELAKVSGVSQQLINAWETSRCQPTQKLLLRVCNSIHCPPKFFFVATDDNNGQQP
jgi:transcriptional regulator with XRE-family HTH domain